MSGRAMWTGQVAEAWGSKSREGPTQVLSPVVSLPGSVEWTCGIGLCLLPYPPIR